MKGKLDKFAKMEKQIESLRIENKLLNDTADNSQLLKEQVCMTEFYHSMAKGNLNKTGMSE